MFARFFPKRHHFALRLLLHGLPMMMVYNIGLRAIPPIDTPVLDRVLLAIPGMYIILGVWFCFDCRFLDAVYCVSSAHPAQNIVFNLYWIAKLRFGFEEGSLMALNNVLAKKTGSDAGLIAITESEAVNADNAIVWTLDAADVETYSANVHNVLQDADINDPVWNQLVDQITLDEAMHFIQEGSDDFDGIDSVGFPTVPNHDGPVGFAYDQISAYTAHWAESDSKAPTYVSADDPYASYSMAVLPTEPVVAATFNQELVEREGELYGEDSLWAKAPVSFSPAINLHRTPYCARNHEYYSEDPMLTNLMAVAICKGGAKKGLMMEVKHLAFNHQEMNRVGISTFITEQAGREGDLRAFQGACSGNYAKGVMSAYNRVGDVYAGGSAALQTDILRNEWGYTGWIVTDMAVPPEYMNWREAVYGGGCVVLTSTNTFAQGQIGTMEARRAEIMADTEFQRKMKDGIKYYLYTFAGSNANRMTIVPPFIWGAIAVEVLMIIVSFAAGNKNILNLSVVISAVLMAIALAQSFNSQLDALGYAYAGLYTIDQVMPFIRFVAVCAVSFLMFIVCAFMDLGRE